MGLATAFVLGWSASASAAPLGLGSCETVEGVYRCDGLVKTWDGVPLDVTVVLPSADAADLPLVTEIHGFGNSKYEYLDPASQAYTDNAYNWAKEGYAVLTYTARGLWGSCGTPEARLASPADCASGYIHLADARYEARDAQELIGRLVDEGIADPARIGVTGDSYGGGTVLRARRPPQPDNAARRHPRALDQPGRDAAQHRRRGPGDPLDEHRRRHRPERPDPRL